MAKTYFFYDLETSGLNPRDDRIMQFAGQRTDENFQPIGEPYNILVTMSDDTLPSIGAMMVTGITPQQTVAEGYSERDFCELFNNEIATPDTIVVGFNNIRFDDEFIRAILWRNYHDAYTWGYADGRSRWDLLDVVRMTRALRPDGINWPTVDGKAVNKLELIAIENGIVHTKAHDALSDVEALIGLTKLIHDKQPQLYDYMLEMRDKNKVKELVSLNDPKPFVYSSGRYDQSYEKTTVAYPVFAAEHGNVFVYDLRHDPSTWLDMNEAELKTHITTPYKKRDENYRPVPVKKLQYNRAPAVAPLGVLGAGDAWQRIGLDKETIEKNLKVLRSKPDFLKRLEKVINSLEKPEYSAGADAEHKLYDGFVGSRDALRMEAVRNLSRDEIKKFQPKFDDKRLAEMWPQYKARNYPLSLNDEERAAYDSYRTNRLNRQAKVFASEINSYMKDLNLTDNQRFIIEEAQLWYESVMPVSDGYDEDVAGSL